MKKIRKSIFETNSSSVHSIAFSRRDIEDSNLPMDEDGKIQAHYGSFGSETRSYNDQETKLSYLITLPISLMGRK